MMIVLINIAIAILGGITLILLFSLFIDFCMNGLFGEKSKAKREWDRMQKVLSEE